MFSYVWPVVLIVFSNIIYQICAKGIPVKMNTYASMTITYAVAALFSLSAYFATTKGGNIIKEFSHANWATVVLGIVITGLELGFIFAYKAGWKVSVLATVTNGLLSIALIVVGLVIYHEHIEWRQIAGVALCLLGLWFINRK